MASHDFFSFNNTSGGMLKNKDKYWVYINIPSCESKIIHGFICSSRKAFSPKKIKGNNKKAPSQFTWETWKRVSCTLGYSVFIWVSLALCVNLNLWMISKSRPTFQEKTKTEIQRLGRTNCSLFVMIGQGILLWFLGENRPTTSM